MKREFLRYIGVGGAAFVVDFALLAILVSAGLHYLAAAIPAYLVGTWVNYWLSVRLVFGFRAIDIRGIEFGLFLLVGVTTLGLSLVLMALLVDGFAVHVLLAKCLIATFTLVANFAARRALLFTRWGRLPMLSVFR